MKEKWAELFDKHVVENRGLLSKAKYLRKKIKAGKAENWMVEMFETILAMRSNEHTGGRRKASHENEDCFLLFPNDNTQK